MKLGSLVIVEDDSYTRTLLTASLNAHGFEILAGASSALDALTPFEKSKVDIALLDLDLGKGPNGIDIAYKMRELQPNIGLVLITSFTDHRAAGDSRRSLPIGMRQITKSKINDMNQLVRILLEVKARPLSKTSSGFILKAPLTDKQVEILRLINAGLSNQEIARQLAVTVGAVEKSISRINSTLGLENDSSINSRISLVRYFAKLSGKDSGA